MFLILIYYYISNGLPRSNIDRYKASRETAENPPQSPFKKGGGREFPPLEKGDKGGFGRIYFSFADA